MELAYRKFPKLRQTPLILFLVTLVIFISLCYPLLGYPLYLLKIFSKSLSRPSNIARHDSTNVPLITEGCDLFSGEWVPDPDAPYYKNTTCWAIQEHQNCMKYGRPDTGFMKWRWKPHGCELPIFDPVQFLELVRGKSMAFVGDSVGRNQMQSLICLLSKVEFPVDVSYESKEPFKRFRYTTYDFTLVQFWSPHLVKSTQQDADGPTHTGLFSLHLDEFDDEWAAEIEEFDYVIINGGHWFYRPSIYYENHRLVGCRYCLLDNVTDLPMSYGYRKAFRTAFRLINSLKNFNGVTFLRTFAPSHFENGAWNNGGNCLRKRPFRSNETRLEGTELELYLTQVEEFRNAERQGRKLGKRFRLLDTTNVMWLRPDGHPSRYGHWPQENVTLYNDCVHWCLPGPIDSWNQFLLEMLKMENQRMNKQM